MSRVWISFLALICGISCFNPSLATSEINKTRFTTAFETLLQRIKSETPYETITFQRRNWIDCVDENLQRVFPTPTITSVAHRIVLLKQTYKSQILAVTCLRQNYAEQLIVLAHTLKYMRDTKILIIANQDLQDIQNEHFLLAFFQKCEELKFINVNLIYRDFMDSKIYYSFTQFPKFALEVNELADKKIFFPYRLSNLYGKEIVTIPDLVDPRTMLLEDANGHKRMIGYIGRLMNTFAEKHNITWKFWFDIDEHQVLPVSSIREAARNGSVEIGASLSSPMVSINVYEYSYPVEVVQWGTMMPIEQAVPIHTLLLNAFSVQLYLIIFLLYWLLSSVLTLQQLTVKDNGWRTMLTNIIFNDVAMRGILGQSFQMEQLPKLANKFIYFLIFLAGLVISTAYSANLMKLIMKPPTERLVTSFDDLLGKGLKVVVNAKEVNAITSYNGKVWWERYNSVFDVENSPEQYQIRRHSFDTRFGFSMFSSSWPMVEEQQQHFQRRLFRFSPELAFNDCHLFALPINPDTMYRDILDRFLHRVRDTGLFNYWFSMSLYDMISIGKLSFEDLSEARDFQHLTVMDFYWIWMLYFTGIGISMFQFTLEKFCAAIKKNNG